MSIFDGESVPGESQPVTAAPTPEPAPPSASVPSPEPVPPSAPVGHEPPPPAAPDEPAPSAGWTSPGEPASSAGWTSPGATGPGSAGGGVWEPPGPTTSPPGRPGGRRRLAAGIAGVVLVAAAAGGAGAAIGVHVGDSHHNSTVAISGSTDTSIATRPATTAGSGAIGQAAAKILPSVVTINETGSTGGGTGSGVIISADGYILTNNHVVSDAAGGGTLEVVLQSGKKVSASIVGRDPISDLAVVKISNAGTLTPAVLGDSESLHIGDQVVAIGSPLGLSGTVTSGIVSALHRPVATGDPSVSDTNAVIDAIQTDAAINPGNSGGPLVDASGAVVGINSAIATVDSGSRGFGGQSGQSGNIGVGFAIPIDAARTIATELIRTGHATHAYLGVQASTSNADQSGAGDSNDDGNGAVIGTVEAGGPADKAGMRVGDVITAVGSRKVTGVESLITSVQTHVVGDRVTVTYERGGKESSASVTLGALPASTS